MYFAIEVGTEVTFDAAHFLPSHPGKCSELHGHTWRVLVRYYDVCIDSMPDILVDFGVIKATIMDEFDHKNMNDFLTMPTAENIAIYIAEMLPGVDDHFYSLDVTVYESVVSYAKVAYNLRGDMHV